MWSSDAAIDGRHRKWKRDGKRLRMAARQAARRKPDKRAALVQHHADPFDALKARRDALLAKLAGKG